MGYCFLLIFLNHHLGVVIRVIIPAPKWKWLKYTREGQKQMKEQDKQFDGPPVKKTGWEDK